MYGSTYSSHFSGYLWGQTVRYLDGHQIYSARFLVAERHDVNEFMIPFQPTNENVDRILEISLLYGFAFSNRYFLLSGSVGLGYVDQRTSPTPSIASAAIPFDFQMSFTPTRIVGVGLLFFGNLNPKTSYSGATLTLLIGSL